jgi:hypothetical protein
MERRKQMRNELHVYDVVEQKRLKLNGNRERIIELFNRLNEKKIQYFTHREITDMLTECFVRPHVENSIAACMREQMEEVGFKQVKRHRRDAAGRIISAGLWEYSIVELYQYNKFWQFNTETEEDEKKSKNVTEFTDEDIEKWLCTDNTKPKVPIVQNKNKKKGKYSTGWSPEEINKLAETIKEKSI